PGNVMLAARPGALGASRALGLIVSLATGTAGIPAGVPGSHRFPAPARPSQSRTSEARAAGVARGSRIAAVGAPRPPGPGSQVPQVLAARGTTRPAVEAPRTAGPLQP